MADSGAEPNRDKLNDDLAEMTRHLQQIGPDINEVARKVGAHKETVRYRYHKFFSERGLSVQAMPNYRRLGFKRLILLARLSPRAEQDAVNIFKVMNELCYLHSFMRIVPEGSYVIHVAAPGLLVERCISLYGMLLKVGVFAELEVLRFDDMKNPPMRPEYYDFGRKRWSVSFNLPLENRRRVHLDQAARSQLVDYDKTDLLILKELDIDANRTMVKMAENTQVNVKTLEFHYLNHVQTRGLIRGYRIIWQGTRYDPDVDKAVYEPSYVGATILLQDCTDEERDELSSLLNQTPFLWSEASEPAYYAEAFVPAVSYVDFLQHLSDFASKVGKRMRIFVIDQSRALRFTISYGLFNNESRQWELNEEDVIRSFGNLMSRTSPLAQAASTPGVRGLCLP